jgi:hypothetical protein
MCKKLIFVISLVSILTMVNSSSAEMVGHWMFDGDLNDSFGQAHGTFNGGSPAYVTGRIGQGIDFNGVNQFVHIPLENPSAYTITLWVRPARTDAASVIVRTSGSGPTTHWSHQLRINPQGAFHHYLYIGSELNLAGTTLVEADEWYHVAIAAANNSTMHLYVNGEEDATPINVAGTLWGDGDRYYVASNSGHSMGWFQGIVDDVQIYDNILTAEEVERIVILGGGFPLASKPTPKDGAVYAGTWVSLSWRAGDFTTSHDVYMGENFDDVNEGNRDSEVFRGNLGLDTEFYIAGFPPYAYPDGLLNGTTYYWRIDEVNDAEPNSPWKGPVWSFWIPPKTAYDPVPADGGKFIDSENLTLSWTAGFGAKLHTVYFGDDYDTVANATGGSPLTVTNFSPGSLEPDKTYYWRVDELEAPITHTGDVWSFTTMPEIAITDPNLVGWWTLDEGQGITAVDWSGHGHHGTLINDPQWEAGYHGGALAFDGRNDYISVPIDVSETQYAAALWFKTTNGNCGLMAVVDSDLGGGGHDRHIYLADGNIRIRLWDTEEIATAGLNLANGLWHHVAYTYGTTIGGQSVYVDGVLRASGTKNASDFDWQRHVNIGFSNDASNNYFEGVMDDVRIYDKALTLDEVKETMRGDLTLAWNPKPGNGSTPYIKDATPLSWSPGENASQHDVYFGTDGDAVADADTSTADIYHGRQSAITYTPPEGVEWGGGPYYWRIDQVNTDGTISTGRVWTFTVADFIPVEDFESYDVDKPVWEYWLDGLGFGAPDTPDFNPGNGTGAAVGDDASPSYMEETIVNSGRKSLPYFYDNNKQGYAKYSEAELTLTTKRDWTEQGVAELSLWFRGYPASTGSFFEGPVGIYTMTGSGADIWNVNGVEADEFHFAYKMLTGAGSIIARVDNVENTNGWAKAGVMIRESLNPDSAHAFACITPSNGVASQGRPSTGGASFNTNQTGITAPYWVKLERSISGLFTVSHSANGTSWQAVTGATPQNIPMGSNVYIGLALTAHDAALTCQAIFSNIMTTGNITGQWTHQDIGITSNDAETLYVAVSNTGGTPSVVVHDDPTASQIDTWTEWVIPLQTFADQGINLINVDRIAIGLGTKGNTTVPGGSGKMYFNDIRLYRPRPEPLP